ncbi:MAG: cob(I)yrinic acid a,c-diamide adenosyltransferase [Desulfobacterota bacterium]|nr:cob(I)yrinic acid a,c-diamide adenosyltransferase [Thermodesulfobacteriota bacterium]MDW8002845.1 cob(I)yrinic acid a,c-diamide adenosyltransferase [Deltaproteobacteria bacterium]
MRETKKIKKGYVQLYTGNGKGKTTAALGLALRACGHGIRTYIGQFMKALSYGESKAIRLLKPYIEIEKYGKKGFVHVKGAPDEKDIELAKKGLEKAKKALFSGRYGIVILDEVITAIHFGLISKEEILDLIKRKPEGVELVLTGRYAPEDIVCASDLVTEMKEVKHYYSKGVLARRGIEY